MVLKKDQENAINGKKMTVFESFWHDEKKRAKSTPTFSPPSEPQTEQDGEILREQRVSEAEVHLGSKFNCRAEITKCTNETIFGIFEILPNVNIIKRIGMAGSRSAQQKTEKEW